MATPKRGSRDSEDFEFGDEWLEDDLFDPEDIPMPHRDGLELDEYIERKQKKRRQRNRRKERNDRYSIDREGDD
jgi:hypothetical protein